MRVSLLNILILSLLIELLTTPSLQNTTMADTPPEAADASLPLFLRLPYSIRRKVYELTGLIYKDRIIFVPGLQRGPLDGAFEWINGASGYLRRG